MARTVLLADDSVTAQNMGRRILMDAGYEVITVNNGSAALKKIHESRPDLIVLDVYMPGYGGLEVCQRLKESRETARIPILLTVGKMEPFKSDEAKRVRADGHIVKPFEASELLAALTKLEDRIVPQPETGRGRKSKKARSWHAGEDPAQAPDEWTEKIAYLASAKERLISQSPEGADEPVEAVAESSKRAAATPAAPVEPAPELPVVASPEPVAEESALPSAASEEPATQISFSEEPVVEVSAQAAEVEPAAEMPVAAAELDSPVPEQAQEETERSPAVAAAAPEEPSEAVVAEAEEPPEKTPASADLETPARKPRWIAETVALSAEEAALELEAEMKQAQAQSETVVASINADAATPNTVSETSQPVSDQPNGATFAAAASASAPSSGANVNAVSSAQEREDPAGGLDAAAAWQNWQHIRDSVMSPQSAAALAESLAQTAKAAAEISAAPSDLSAAVEATSASPANDEEVSVDGEALASIVDSVLAELKPKLMQEIAKKLKK